MKNWINCGLGTVVAIMLGGCANAPTASGDANSSAVMQGKNAAANTVLTKVSENVAISNAIAQADAAYKTNQTDKATALLKQAATAYPADKMPWVRMAQAKFDSANYSEAIVNAQEALKRDPKDKVANSIIVVSGLRISTKALADLRSQNEISGSLRSEVQELAKILRESLGKSELVSMRHKPVRYKTAKAKKSEAQITRSPAKSAGVSAGAANPFSALK